MGLCHILNPRQPQVIVVKLFLKFIVIFLLNCLESIMSFKFLSAVKIIFLPLFLWTSIFYRSQELYFLAAEKHSRVKPLSNEEERCIKVFYEIKLQEVCNNFHFPHKIQVGKLFYWFCKLAVKLSVLMNNFTTLFFCSQPFEIVYDIQATALIFFKRFYLQWSVMEHQPKNIM